MTVERAPSETATTHLRKRTIWCAERGVKCVLRRVALERSTSMRKQQIDQEKRGPRIFTDFHVISKDDGSTPVLAFQGRAELQRRHYHARD